MQYSTGRVHELPFNWLVLIPASVWTITYIHTMDYLLPSIPLQEYSRGIHDSLAMHTYIATIDTNGASEVVDHMLYTELTKLWHHSYLRSPNIIHSVP